MKQITIEHPDFQATSTLSPRPVSASELPAMLDTAGADAGS